MLSTKVTPLFPGEATVVAGAVDSRRKEFTTGRHCARTALSETRPPVRAPTRSQPGINCDRTPFCAKEAVYKTWYPVTRRWLDLHDAEVTLDAGRGTFEARILVPGLEVAGRRIDTVAGRWRVAGNLVVTAIRLPVIDITGRT